MTCRVFIVLFFVLLAGCKNASADKEPNPKSSGADVPHDDEPEHEGLAKRVRLSPRALSASKIRTAPATTEVLSATVTLPGEIVADPDRSARVSTPIAGRLTDVRFKEGSKVTKGQALGTVRIPELGKVRGALAAANAKATAARTNADRLSTLADKGLAAKQEALSAKADADALDAETSALREQLAALGGPAGNNGELVIRAPVSGVVVARDAVIGQPVTTEQTIAMIADLDEAWFLGRVFEKDLGRLNLGARAEVELNAYPKEHFEGTIEYLGKQIDPAARTVTARIRLTNRADILRIGLFGSARVSVDEDAKRTPALVIPRSALTEIGGKSVVFVRHADDDFELHEVVLGDAALGKVEIVSGLREGEQIVTEGVFTLKSAVLKGSLKEDD
ncbi:Cobalt/zinc/cadmium efflux RND transporter, membrane fusion protein, CzcB family [Labilithrix luteola]|uniref:Cobalt/zinc/cadmium efflux RND transporter, membrane fusion protein, CzcB family n=1 Tax=Labilithrix luteola TaxID=1391654 RepID=A0A0K1PN51_9BACT|nr:efflux RND transporter periplasmic adaptor subunit [Labilithrix luteola]AKU94942.1 Cobalt/zinc/cadmium efflux RND transporter, membrane fusion protein, CzcB family [Labilithrix luteola]